MSEEELTDSSRSGLVPIIIAVVIIVGGLVFLFAYDARKNRFTNAPDSAFEARAALTSSAEISGHAISPDGSSLAVATAGPDGTVDLSVGTVGVESRVPLTDTPAVESAPTWSRDGQSIAFARHEGDRAELIVVPFRGGRESVVATIEGEVPDLDWRDGQIYLTQVLEDGVAILRVEIESSGLEPVAMATDEGVPHWIAISPDGNSLALSRNLDGAADLFIRDLRTGEERRLTSDRQPIHGIAWTGESIIYSVGPEESAKLWRITPEGLKLAELRTPGAALEPSISEDGRRILYRRPDGHVLELLEM